MFKQNSVFKLKAPLGMWSLIPINLRASTAQWPSFPLVEIQSFSLCLSVVPFTQPVQGRNVGPLCCVAVLYERYEHGMGGYCCTGIKSAAEVVTEPDRRLCKSESWHGGTTH